MAREYMALQEKNTAIQTLKNCLRELPESMSCMYYLASIQIQSKNYREALKYFNLILNFNPENPRILQTIAEIHLERKDYSKAISVFKQIRKYDPSDVAATIRLGLIYFQQKQVDKAIAEFSSVYKVFPKSDRVNYFLGLMYQEKKDFDKAFLHFDKINPKSSFFKETLSRMLFILRKKGEPASAVVLLDKKVSKKDKTVQYYRIKTSLYITDHDYKKALSTVNQGLSKYKNHLNLLFQKSLILEKIDQWEEAKEILFGLINGGRSSDRIYNFLGYTMLVRDGEVDEAIKYIEKAKTLNPNDGHIVDSLAWAYFKKGEVNKALNLLFKANQLTPNEPTILEHLGDVYLHLKNKRKAREYFEKSASILQKIQKPSPLESKQLKDIQNKLGEF